MSLFTHPIEYLHCNLMYSIKWCTITGTVKPSDNTKVCLCSAVTWHYPLPVRTGQAAVDGRTKWGAKTPDSAPAAPCQISLLPPFLRFLKYLVFRWQPIKVLIIRMADALQFATILYPRKLYFFIIYEIHSVIWTSEILAQITWPTKSRDLSNYVPYQITWPTSTTSRDLFQFPAAGESARKTKEVRVFPTK